MKNSKKIILISIITLMILPFFLIPRAAVAQEWTYNGADTERIPEFSVYPSEWYVYSTEYLGTPGNHTIFKIVKANISDTFWGMTSFPPYYGTFTNDTVITANIAQWNMTTDEIRWAAKNFEAIYWNGSTYLAMKSPVVPIDEGTGTVTASILSHINYFMNVMYNFEYNATYPNIYSIAQWNSTTNNNYIKVNFTSDGIIQKAEYSEYLYMPNTTLYSQPAQLPPIFSFTTETGSLDLSSTDVKLNITITDADNNNDGVTDTDYLYRIQNGTGWTDWGTPPSQLDWDLGDITSGDHNITIEVKNMYGVTQEVITVTYTAPGDGIIPGYSLGLISLAAIFGISIIIIRHQKKLKT